MELRPATPEQLETVYDADLKVSFPAAELKPLRIIQRMLEDGYYRPWCLFDGAEIVGECFLWLGEPGWALLDYLCISPRCRNGGLGALLLEKMLEAEPGVVILGESARELPLSESLSYFINTMDSRADVNVLMAEKSASEVLNADINQGILPALTIEKTVQNADDSGKISEVLLIDILRSLAAEHQSALIPVIAIAQGEDAANGVDESKKLKNIELTGMAVFSEGMYQGTLNESETRGMMFLRDEIQKTVYSVFNEDFREISVELYRSNTKIVPHINGDDLQFTVKINADGMVQEKVLEAGKSFNEKSLRRVEDVIQEKIRSECEEAFQKSVGEYKSDVFYLGDMVWRDQPELWERLQDNWKENAGKIKLSYDITVDIDRTGLQENFKGVL